MDIKTLLGDSDITILAKFVEPKFVDTTMDGNFNFARNKYFIELEEKENSIGIADKNEGNWSLLLEKGSQIIFETEEEGLVLPVTPNVIHTRYDVTTKVPINCFVYLSVKKDFEIVPNINEIKLKSEVEIELKKQFVGRHLILIRDMWKLQERFEKSVEAMNLHLSRGLVKYFDEQSEPHPLTEEEYEKNPFDALFYKSNFFEHQKEFRFVIGKISEYDVPVSVGNIEDIAVDLGKVEIDKELLPTPITFKKTAETEELKI